MKKNKAVITLLLTVVLTGASAVHCSSGLGRRQHGSGQEH